MRTPRSDIFLSSRKKDNQIIRTRATDPIFQLFNSLPQLKRKEHFKACKSQGMTQSCGWEKICENVSGRERMFVRVRKEIMGVWGGSGNLISREDLINSIFLRAFERVYTHIPTTISILHLRSCFFGWEV